MSKESSGLVALFSAHPDNWLSDMYIAGTRSTRGCGTTVFAEKEIGIKWKILKGPTLTKAGRLMKEAAAR